MNKIKNYDESHALDWLNQGRVLFYQPRDNTGFGNKIRGLVGSFVFCLLSHRFLFMADEFLHNFFLSPFQFSWLAQDYPVAKRYIKNLKELSPPLRPDYWSDDFWKFFSKEKVESFPSHSSIWYTESTSFYDALLENRHYRHFFSTMDLIPNNKVSTVGEFSSLLLSNVRKVWLSMKEQLIAKSSTITNG